MVLLTLFVIIFSSSTTQINLHVNDKIMNTNQDKDQIEILATARQLSKLTIEKDINGINKILSDDFTLTHITGYVQRKKEWLEEIELERMKYYSSQEVSIKIDINGNKATLIDRNIIEARIYGSRNNWRIQQTMYLEKVHGVWIIFKSVASTF